MNGKSAGPDCFWSLHPGGANFLCGDGSVRFVKESISPATATALATRAGGDASGDY